MATATGILARRFGVTKCSKGWTPSSVTCTQQL